jgi:HEAT repeat protein
MSSSDDRVAAEIARLIIQAKSESEAGAVVQLINQRSDARGALERLARHSDPVIRAWVASASSAIGSEADRRSLLRTLARDRDADVRDVAVEEILRTGSESDTAFAVAQLVRQLGSSSFGSNRYALWTLARLRATSARDAILEFGADVRNPWKAKAASVAIALIDGRDTDVLRAIDEHDHDRMMWLATAAGIIGSQIALDALRSCSANAPDEQCRADCAGALAVATARWRN